MKRKILWQPTKRQAKALTAPTYELFYGGAKGGGKSDFLLMDFVKLVQKYKGNHRGILFRRTFPELEELIYRSRQLYGHMAHFKEGDKEWIFSSKASLKMRFLELDADVHKYQGHQYSWIGFDELTNWGTDYCYIYMHSCARSPAGVPVRVRASGNPGSVGHVWVRERFVSQAPRETVYKDPKTDLTRVFIPALLDDNKHLIENDPEYENRLKLLPPHLYRAYRFGDWDVFAGQVFEEFRREEHVIQPFALDRNWFRFCSLDWGYAKPYSVGFWAVTSDGRMIRFDEMYGDEPYVRNVGIKKPATVVAKEAWEMGVPLGIDDMVADPSCWAHHTDRCIADDFVDAGFTMHKGNRDRESGLARCHDLMKTTGHDGRPMIQVVDKCHAFIRTVPALVYDEKRPEDVNTKMEDHPYDDWRYAATSHLAHWRPTGRRPHRSDYNRSGASDEKRQLEYDPLGRN